MPADIILLLWLVCPLSPFPKKKQYFQPTALNYLVFITITTATVHQVIILIVTVKFCLNI